MDSLRQQVERARRRMVQQQFWGRLVWCLSAALLVAVIAIAVPKLVAVPDLPAHWAEWWLGSGVATGILAALGWTYFKRRDALDAAIEIDQRFDLRERVASSLSLPESEQESEVGKALINDAVRTIERIDVGERFPIRVRRAWLPLVPAVIAFCLMSFVGNREAESTPGQQTPTTAKQEVKKSIEELRKKLAKKKKDAEAKKLKDATGLLKQVQKGVEDLAKKPDADHKKAVVKLNDLAKQLEDRHKKLGGKKAVQDQLNKMKNLGKGPAEKAAEAMKQGDWDKAIEQIKQMQKKLADGDMSKEDQKKLAEQLKQMQQQLQQASDAQKQKMDDLKKQIEEKRRKGNQQEAGKLQEKLDQMQQQQQQMQKMEQMAQKMGKAAEAMEKGDQQAAADAMQQMADQLEQMQQEVDEMEMLADAMDQIEMAKQQMGCKQCQGQGCQACGGMGMGQGQGKGEGEGQGMGEGRGKGPRPDEKNPTNMRDTKVKQNVGRGSSVFGGQVKGPNIKGKVQESIKEGLSTSEAAEAEALQSERLPRPYREHTQEFFKNLKEKL